MIKAIEMAKKNGVAVVGMSNMAHSGSIGYYSEMAAKESTQHVPRRVKHSLFRVTM